MLALTPGGGGISNSPLSNATFMAWACRPAFLEMAGALCAFQAITSKSLWVVFTLLSSQPACRAHLFCELLACF